MTSPNNHTTQPSTNHHSPSANATPATGTLFSHHETLLRKMQRHRSDIFSRISSQIEKTQRDVKQCHTRFDELKRKLTDLESELESEETRWKDRYERDLRESMNRIKSVGGSSVYASSMMPGRDTNNTVINDSSMMGATNNTSSSYIDRYSMGGAGGGSSRFEDNLSSR